MSTYYVVINEQQVGPLTEEEIRRKHSSGQIAEDTLLWKEGMKDWAPLKELQLVRQETSAEPPALPTSAEGATPSSTAAAELQFEKADFQKTEASALTCVACKKPIASSYYEINKQVTCAACHDAVQAAQIGGSGLSRFLRAALAGTGAAGVGAGIWYLVMSLTGYEIGLIAIVVGFLVGFAVRWGSKGRGGWGYQTLAIFLTYTSIVSTYVPMILKEIRAQEQRMSAERAIEPSADSQALATSESQEEQPEVVFVGEKDVAAEQDVVRKVVTYVLAIVFAFAAPFLMGLQSILGLIIIGIGLFEAWKLNKRAKYEIAGPFLLGTGGKR